MIKCEVIEKFNLKDFAKLKNVKRVAKDVEGKLFVGDTFECDETMADYLTGNNVLKKAVVKIIEVAKKGTTKEAKIIEEIVKEEKPKKSNKKKTK